MHSSKPRTFEQGLNLMYADRKPGKYYHVFLLLVLIGMYIPGNMFADGMEDNDPSLVGTWQWMGTVTPVEEITPPAGETYTIIFTVDGTITMKLEANRIDGSYEADGKKLKVVPPMIMTMVAWIPDSPAPGILNLMEHATGYFFKERELYIDTLADGGTLRFKPVN